MGVTPPSRGVTKDLTKGNALANELGAGCEALQLAVAGAADEDGA